MKIENGRVQFLDNLYDWGKRFHNGNRFNCNIAGTRKFEDHLDTFEWPDSSADENEADSLERFFNRKRIKI